MTVNALLLFLHISSVVVWVGGMFFAYVCLRPAAALLLEPAPRLRLWCGVFARFFACLWWAIGLLAASGLIMFARHGISAAPIGWHLMLASGLVMMAIFIYVVTGPYAALRRAVAGEDWKGGAAALGRIRQMVYANLLLGLLTIAFATLGALVA